MRGRELRTALVCVNTVMEVCHGFSIIVVLTEMAPLRTHSEQQFRRKWRGGTAPTSVATPVRAAAGASQSECPSVPRAELGVCLPRVCPRNETQSCTGAGRFQKYFYFLEEP